MTELAPYYQLGPDAILDAVESTGRRCSGHLQALNSYENRVYQVGIEEGGFLVAKFYRPGRWNDEAILEEHAFAAELAGADVQLVAPLEDGGKTLHRHQGYRFALFPRRGGRAPELDRDDHLEWIGRFMGRLHAVAATAGFHHRPGLDLVAWAHEAHDALLESGFLPEDLAESWRSTVGHVLERLESHVAARLEYTPIRLHGDCHAGNILWTDDGPHFVDLDDCITGPAVQDLWMLLSGDRVAMSTQLDAVLEGYTRFFEFDPRELHLVEPLRTLRMLRHAAWIAARWEDPAFPAAFPWFTERRHWESQVLALREQMALLDEPPLQLDGFRG